MATWPLNWALRRKKRNENEISTAVEGYVSIALLAPVLWEVVCVLELHTTRCIENGYTNNMSRTHLND